MVALEAVRTANLEGVGDVDGKRDFTEALELFRTLSAGRLGRAVSGGATRGEVAVEKAIASKVGRIFYNGQDSCEVQW